LEQIGTINDNTFNSLLGGLSGFVNFAKEFNPISMIQNLFSKTEDKKIESKTAQEKV
jgi:hypothetical protein